MSILILIILFIFGISIGSFLGVVIDRLPKNQSVVAGRSHCDHCNHVLAWFDLIPLFSFLVLGGKCRYCKKKLSNLFILIELLTGFIFVALALFFSPLLHLWVFLFYVYIFCSLLVIFFIDLFDGIIPDIVLFPAILITIIFTFLTTPTSVLSYGISAVISFVFFFFLFAVTKGHGMGFGDVKYAFFMGLLLGWPNILFGMYAAFLTGAIISLILVIWGKRKFFGGTIPFGPFLVFGTMFGIFFGSALWNIVSRYLF